MNNPNVTAVLTPYWQSRSSHQTVRQPSLSSSNTVHGIPHSQGTVGQKLPKVNIGKYKMLSECGRRLNVTWVYREINHMGKHTRYLWQILSLKHLIRISSGTVMDCLICGHNTSAAMADIFCYRWCSGVYSEWRHSAVMLPISILIEHTHQQNTPITL
jgi:hypothetical protein